MLYMIKLLEYVKTLLWDYLGNNMLHWYTLARLRENEDYRDLLNPSGKNSRRIILLDTPVHGNLGDQAIALAERAFIGKFAKQNLFFEFTNLECRANLRDIKKGIKQNDVVLIHGGGFIGTLWPAEERLFIQILKKLKENKIIVFPQTIYFEKSRKGDREWVRFEKAVKACSDITIFTRDKNSYDCLKNSEILPAEQFFLVPDIVMSYQMKRYEHNEREKLIWICLRSDTEKTFNHHILDILIAELRKMGYRVEMTDTVIEGEIRPKERYHAVHTKLSEFAQGELVITDRLHGMVFSALSETPCIAVDNVSKKVSGGYEWLKHLDYIRCISGNELTMELIMEMMKKKNCKYTNECLHPYYEVIKNQIIS